MAPPTPLAEEQSLLFFHGDARVQPALLAQLAEDAEKRMIDWKIVRLLTLPEPTPVRLHSAV